MRRRAPRGPGSAAIVATVLAPGRSITSFVRYHLEIGFERFYLFFDDPADPDAALVKHLPGVSVLRSDAALEARRRRLLGRARLAPFLDGPGRARGAPEALMARQIGNAAIAIPLARRDGIAWLLHIDCDELFYPGPPAPGAATAHFERLAACGVGRAHYTNHEAVCAAPEHGDPFREITLFKRNPSVLPEEALLATADYWSRRGGYFLAYENGKSAVRAIEGAEPAGPHGFRLPPGELGSCHLALPAVLHYPYSGFERYWRKHARLGDFRGDSALGRPWEPPPFLLASRDLVREGRVEDARRLYRRAVVLRDRRRIAALTGLGVLARIEGPALLLDAIARRAPGG